MKAGSYNYYKISKLLSIYFFVIAASMAVCIIGIIVDSLFLEISSFFITFALYIFVYIYEANDHLRWFFETLFLYNGISMFYI